MKCKNDASKSYKGTEPSPKGNGWCAHAEKPGKRRKGTDGNMWIVSKIRTSQRWMRAKAKAKATKPTKRKARASATSTKRLKRVPSSTQCAMLGILPLPLDISKFATYRKKHKPLFQKRTIVHRLTGLELNPGKIHKLIGLNQFEVKETPIPWGFKKIRQPSKGWMKSFAYDPIRHLLCKTDSQVEKIRKEHVGWNYYFIHDNSNQPFLVYLQGKKADIFAMPSESAQFFLPGKARKEKGSARKWQYIVPVASYTNVVKAWIGKSPKTSMTLFSGGHGPTFDGNSIILTLPKNMNVYIGGGSGSGSGDGAVQTFKTPTPIVEYWSPVGNNDVPYPVAFTKNDAYFMLDFECVALDQFKRRLTTKDKQDLYSAY